MAQNSTSKDAFVSQRFAPKLGDRVQMHPATDAWTQGDRYGTVEMLGTDIDAYHVRMDRSERLLRVLARDLMFA